MSLENIKAGKNPPHEFNVMIEISANSDPVKYEVDENGHLWVDRFIGTGMRYPCNYGFIPHTLAGDGDPVDALVITPFPLIPGSIVPCRALGMLAMSDEAGEDAKLIVVPTDKVCKQTSNLKSLDDVNDILKQQIKHFFEQYKALEPGKWVKVEGWLGLEAAHQEIIQGLARVSKNP
jgi:inorganic pyrophosphatase